MTNTTPTPISEESLDSLIETFEGMADSQHPDTYDRDTATALKELRFRRSQAQPVGRWIPWRPGDALPATAPVLHWTTWFDKEYTDVPMTRANHAHDFERWGVTAYWSEPLPPPYAALIPIAPEPAIDGYPLYSGIPPAPQEQK